MRRSRVLSAAILGAMVLGGTLFGGAAFGARPSSTTSGGTIYVSVTPNNGTTYPIVIAGAIADYGTATTIDQNGKVDPNGNYVKMVLKQGGFEINSTTLNKKANSTAPTANNTTNCSYSFTASGPVTVFDGSGAYKGISGTLAITESFDAILPRISSGKDKGQCNESTSATPIASNGNISGSGRVMFS
jgi:hypothetical protein